jgi:hypothetical protein
MFTWQAATHWAIAAALAAAAAATLAAPNDAVPGDTGAVRKPPPTRAIDHPTGATEGSPQGSVSGGMTTTPAPEKEQQRANTAPGKDRDGHGPAAGAIVDPSGAATRSKPF